MRQRALLRIRLVRHQQKDVSFMGLGKTERELAAKGEGCLGKAADDEPVFILRAQDIFAPDLVREWADLISLVKLAKGTLRDLHPKIIGGRAGSGLLIRSKPRGKPAPPSFSRKRFMMTAGFRALLRRRRPRPRVGCRVDLS